MDSITAVSLLAIFVVIAVSLYRSTKEPNE